MLLRVKSMYDDDAVYILRSRKQTYINREQLTSTDETDRHTLEMAAPPSADVTNQRQIETLSPSIDYKIFSSPQVGAFLLRENISIVVSAYKVGRVISFGSTKKGELTAHEATYVRPMALALGSRGDCQEVWIASANSLIRCCAAPDVFNNNTETEGEYTSTLVARQQHTIGAQDVHGIYPYPENSVLFLSTKCNALCQLSYARPEETTRVLWKPPFISEIRMEDRCHVNGVCWTKTETDVKIWQAQYATCVSESDAHDGWRDHRESGGIVIDMSTNTVIARGLSMPHSPQWRRGQLWLLSSGTGELGTIDVTTGLFTAKLFLPGFLRGLQFVGNYAIIGSSDDRNNARFNDLELGRKLAQKKSSAVCGVFIVDLTTLSIASKIEFVGDINELYDVLIVPGRRARVLSQGDALVADIHNIIDAIPPMSVPT
jgi:uncharacterized protein (TIGR03032 family)